MSQIQEIAKRTNGCVSCPEATEWLRYADAKLEELTVLICRLYGRTRGQRRTRADGQTTGTTEDEYGLPHYTLVHRGVDNKQGQVSRRMFPLLCDFKYSGLEIVVDQKIMMRTGTFPIFAHSPKFFVGNNPKPIRLYPGVRYGSGIMLSATVLDQPHDFLAHIAETIRREIDSEGTPLRRLKE